MIAQSANLFGVDSHSVEVDVEVKPGSPSFKVVGVPINAEKEMSVRVRSALEHAGYKVHSARIRVDLKPSVPYANSASFDLAVAMAFLADTAVVPVQAAYQTMFVGELALDGTLRRVAGVLPIAQHAAALGMPLIVPNSCLNEAAYSGARVYGASTLAEVVAYLRGECKLPVPIKVVGSSQEGFDLREVRGLETARRALEVAAAGGHNLLLIGPPGSGKSLLARCFPTILPPLDEREALEATAIYSAAGKLDGASLLAARPFRAPHHDVSVAGLVGGGSYPRPGEISLAHHGVLFLDELPEFKRAALEALRQPLEDRRVTIVRARAALTWPASFALAAAMNPCPCGYRGSSLRTCVCGNDQVRRYVGRVSGPLLDRIDLHIEVPHVDYRTLRAGRDGEPSSSVRERVIAARAIQRRRLRPAGRSANAEMGPRHLREHCETDAAGEAHLEACIKRFALSGRAVHRVLRVARTIADLAGRERITASEVAEAVSFRMLDRDF